MNLTQLEAINRKQYFIRFFLLQLVLGLIQIGCVSIRKLDEDAVYIDLIVVILWSLGVLIYLYASAQNNFDRARDIEGTFYISKLKWICLTFIPIIALYGHFILFFKKGRKI